MPHVDKTVNTCAVLTWQATCTGHIYLLFDTISFKHFDVLTKSSKHRAQQKRTINNVDTL